MSVLAALATAAALAVPAAPTAAQDTAATKRAICTVFGSRFCGQALRVARCESGYSVWATNGQYVNVFQMGYRERQRYGWHVAGSPAWVAARAAYNYFRASHYSWRAWTCGYAA